MGYEYNCQVMAPESSAAWNAILNVVSQMSELEIIDHYGQSLSLKYKDSLPSIRNSAWKADIYLEYDEKGLYVLFNLGSRNQRKYFFDALSEGLQRNNVDLSCEEL